MEQVQGPCLGLWRHRLLVVVSSASPKHWGTNYSTGKRRQPTEGHSRVSFGGVLCGDFWDSSTCVGSVCVCLFEWVWCMYELLRWRPEVEFIYLLPSFSTLDFEAESFTEPGVGHFR